MAKKIKIVFCGGGSGGHLFPTIAVIREIRRLSSNERLELHYIGPEDKKTHFLLSQEDVNIHSIFSGKIRRYFSFENFTDVLFKIPYGFLQSFFLMLFINPKLVFSKGGSGSVPVTLSAGMLGNPVFLHESDSTPGLSNKITSKWAKKVFTSFPKTGYFNPSKIIITGNPILKELLEGDNTAAKEIFGLTFENPVLLFWGGSQGAAP